MGSGSLEGKNAVTACRKSASLAKDFSRRWLPVNEIGDNLLAQGTESTVDFTVSPSKSLYGILGHPRHTRLSIVGKEQYNSSMQDPSPAAQIRHISTAANTGSQ